MEVKFLFSRLLQGYPPKSRNVVLKYETKVMLILHNCMDGHHYIFLLPLKHLSRVSSAKNIKVIRLYKYKYITKKSICISLFLFCIQKYKTVTNLMRCVQYWK